MLKEGDTILICFSGGKDSYLLLKILKELQNNYPIKFTLKILTINPNFDKNFETNIQTFLKTQDMDFEILNTPIKTIIEEQNKLKPMSPCFLCSRLRRGIIYDYAIKNGYNKIALGHNLDDAIETHLMNLFYSNKTSFLKPKYLAENGQIEVIRPLIYIDEDIIKNYVNKVKYQPIKNKCPLKQKDSKRDYFKKLISELKKNNSEIKTSAYHAFKNTKELNQWKSKN